MSFSAEVFKKKLDALLETQDLIVSISQWVLFHHRHAGQLCELWAEYALGNAGSNSLKKKLSLLYLCNDVVQQARHKRKPEFAAGFALSLPSVLHVTYGGVDEAVRPKIERLISVWSQRNVFDKSQILAMERALTLLRGGEAYSEMPLAAPKPKAEESVKVAPQLAEVNQLFLQMNTLVETGSASMAQVAQQLAAYLPENPEAQHALPLPKIYVSKLNVLEKLCRMAAQNVQDTALARAALVAALAHVSEQVAPQGTETESEHKTALLNLHLDRLQQTRSELYEMLGEDAADAETAADTASKTDQAHTQTPKEANFEDEEPSPAFDALPEPTQEDIVVPSAEPNGNLIPTYEDSSDSDSDSDAPRHVPVPAMSRKRRLSASSTISGSSKKSVAFSEQIEVKEYERDEHSNFIGIVGDARGDNGDEHNYGGENAQNPGYGVTEGGSNGSDVPGYDIAQQHEFEAHHKDDVELRHERVAGAGAGSGTDLETTDEGARNGLLSLLSKLS